jgi:hypothetical protein
VIKIAYATTLQVIQRTGLGKEIIDENVGTGDNSETDFDLDNTRIFAGSYTISYAASGSNTFTALTETTHYTLDADSGRIVLEAAGVTAVGTNILYASYWYSDDYTNSIISSMIDSADDEIDLRTGQKWDSATSKTEYRSGRASLSYPTTDRPYQSDWDQSDFIVLDNKPVTTVDAVYFLARPQSVANAFNYDLGTTTFTAIEDNLNSTSEAPVGVFDDAPATGDIIYIGGGLRFLGMTIRMSTVGVDNGSTAVDWEYYNGTSWVDLTETAQTTGTDIFTASGDLTWSFPYGWTETTVNSVSGFWIRGTLTDDYSVDPVIATLSLNDSISTIVEPYQWILKANNMLNFAGLSVPNGTDNIRVDYNYGRTTTPSYITDLSIALASLRAFVGLSGGSFDDATSYTLGSKSVTIGEVYVNIREVIAQINKRIDSLYNLTGKRANVVAI